MKSILVTIMLGIFLLTTACTEQSRVKTFGGEMTIYLEKNEKFVIATWKDTDLWYLTRPMEENEKPTTFKFTEQSSLGVMEGVVYFKERR